MKCPKCKHQETFAEQWKAILFRRCPSCGKQFQYPMLMTAAVALILVVSANTMPGIMTWPVLFRLVYFLAGYYVLFWLFDTMQIFRRNYYD